MRRVVQAVRRTAGFAQHTRTLSTNKDWTESAVKGRVAAEVSEDVTDYSEFHQPVGRLLKQLPSKQDDIQQYRLSTEQLRFYDNNGYVGGVPALSSQQCDMLLEELATLADPSNPHPGHGLFHEYHANQTQDPNNVLLHALGHWRITPGFHDLIFLPSITVPASQLVVRHGSAPFSAVRFWHDQLFCKPAHHGGNVAWHQDYSYWTRTRPMQHLTVHVALEDQTADNGAIMYVPGSHHWTRDGAPLPITADDFADMDSIQAVLTEDERRHWKPVHCCLKKGEAVFHHPLVVHGSYGNRSPRSRRAAVVNYFADGTTANTDGPLMDGIPAVPRGQPCAGRFFPLVFDPRWCM
ncbi:phytanoyl-CoA dioxygenase [Salpingoeca rosetta]|uniref:Phytanoyl-CoA dioxygenase n=1 Tax=Salpingoeca rosetta (strain ATCC 50818 / BSB-021) TaxID=946362 RepID=F2U7M3_SALR5|nr:phytanoyl-CoA dioxygenase [Salpingoeca rosetta]EGD83440.1 phytanoyl-CoA dioxygenase [Salpingoeca rosetta]|eukprot:XP_004994944.1 phytanoyl-CoA dioxygenase [Salpingoeca rosetta]